MITDTCKCGAKFSVESEWLIDQSRHHQIWLTAHEKCREQRYATIKEYAYDNMTVKESTMPETLTK